MSIVSIAVFKKDRTLQCARVFIPSSKSFVTSIIDSANKQVSSSNSKQGTIIIEDHVVVYTTSNEQLLMICAQNECNLYEVNLLLNIFSQILGNNSDPFELVYLLDEISASGVANSFLILQQNLKSRIEMYSEAEQKYLENKKIQQKEAEEIRKKREAEIQKQMGNDGLLNAGLRFIGLQKNKMQQGHGIDENELQRMKFKTTHEEPQAKDEPEVQNESESDQEFKIKRKQQNEEDNAPQKLRKGKELKRRKAKELQ